MKNISKLSLVLIGIFMPAALILAHGSDEGTLGYHHAMFGDWGWNMMGFGWLICVLFWVLVVVGLVSLGKYLLGLNKNNENKSALSILNERYAKGDINKEDFEERKNNLNK